MEVMDFKKKGLVYRVILHLPFLAATVLLSIFSVCFGAKGDEKTGVESSSSLSNFVVSITTEYVQNKICSLHIFNHALLVTVKINLTDALFRYYCLAVGVPCTYNTSCVPLRIRTSYSFSPV